MNGDDLAAALTNGASGWMVLSVAAVLPILWAFTLVAALRPTVVIRFLQSLTLRFGGDVWWLSYVLFRDALLVITLGLEHVVPHAQPVSVGLGLPITAPLATVGPVLGAVREADPRRRRDPRPSACSASCSWWLRSSTSSRRSTGSRRPTRRTWATCPSALISSENLAVARPLFWLSLGLFALTAGVMFVRAVMQIRDPKAAADIPGGAA